MLWEVGAFCFLLRQQILRHRPAGQLSLLSSYYRWNVTVPSTSLCCDSGAGLSAAATQIQRGLQQDVNVVSVCLTALIFQKAKWWWGQRASNVSAVRRTTVGQQEHWVHRQAYVTCSWFFYEWVEQIYIKLVITPVVTKSFCICMRGKQTWKSWKTL